MSRQDEDKYRGDVMYDVWRSGGNPDLVDYDRCRDDFFDGIDPRESANRELRRQRPPEPQITEEEYYQEQYPEDYPEEPNEKP